MVFSAASGLAGGAAELRSVQRSLNTPVTAIAELPIGPASAAIAVHADSEGGAAHWTVAVRCERTREIVYFTARGPRAEPGEPSVTADAALSLAEGMGFLFDEPMLQTAREAEYGDANRLWDEFLGRDRLDRDVDSSPLPPRGEVRSRSAVSLTKFRFALKRVGPVPSPGSDPTPVGGSAASRKWSGIRRKKRSWRGFLWRSTQ
jgi:hypothetical protein